MRDLAGKVAVVTGAASGIGLALAERLAAEGMRVVASDVEEGSLAAAEARLRSGGADVLAVRCDVSSDPEVAGLAKRAVDHFGGVHLLCANAGVFSGFRPLWERDATDWEWQFKVNVLGVGNCLRRFVPIMLAQHDDAHIVITASEAGFNVRPFTAVYNATKHAVACVAETLALELSLAGSRIGVSALCPGGVSTRIFDGDRNRPGGQTVSKASSSALADQMDTASRGWQPSGMTPEQVAGFVIDGVREGRFWIFTHPELKVPMRARFEAAMDERNPEPDPRLVARLQTAGGA